jgi:hypothetical protein
MKEIFSYFHFAFSFAFYLTFLKKINPLIQCVFGYIIELVDLYNVIFRMNFRDVFGVV